MGIFDKIKGGAKNLFASHSTVQPTQTIINSETLQDKETYHHWGIRICGIVSGSLNALSPYLQNVYNYIYRKQSQNEDLQEERKQQIRIKIEHHNNDISHLNAQIENTKNQIARLQNHAEELKQEKYEILNGKEQVNKEQRLKLVIGLCIIIPLTFYLFLFYSSSFYSAFFRNTETMNSLVNAMFDPKALNNAINDSFIEFCFVLSAPIIFLGLGFCLHFFSVQEQKSKYLKMAALVLITFSFDCMLAFLIGKKLHEINIMISSTPYTAISAIQDLNTWAVIFCGFIVYIIWGIIFNMIMTAYNEMDLNKIQLKNIALQLKDIEQMIDTKNATIIELQTKINILQNNIATLIIQLEQNVYINTATIRTEMNDFFSGWITQMRVLQCTTEQMSEAHNIFNNTINILIKE